MLVEKDKFYVSNYNYFNHNNPHLMNLELLLQLSLGSLLYFDGKKFHISASNLKGPNGVAVSLDKKLAFKPIGSFHMKSTSYVMEN